MQFKDSGKLIEAGQNGSFFKSLFGKSPYKKISSMSDLEGNDLAKFKSIMKIGEDGLSEYSMADIKAKSSMLGFGDSLTNEITALAKDADFTAKAATGKLTFAKALEDGTISTEELGSALQKHLKETGSKSFNPLVKAAEQGTKEYQDKVRDIIESSDDVANAVIKSGEKVSQKTGIFSSAASLGKGMLTGAKKLVKSVGPYALAAAAAYGGYKLWDHSQTKYTRANEALNKSSGEYETTKTELTSLNSQLDETKSKIEELESLKRTSGGKLSLTDEAELSTLQKQNDELERQITLKQNMADNQAEIVAKDAKSVAKTGQTYTEAMREEHGKVLGTLMGITGHLANPNSGKTASETWAKENGGKNGKATLEQQMKANLKTLKKYKKQLKEAQEDEDQDATDKAQENVDKMTAKVSKQASKLQDIIDKSKDANGNVLKSMASTVDDYNSLITEFNNIDLTKKQKDVNNLDNFFNSSSGSAMKDYLSDIVQNGGSATDALKAFREAGGRLKDIDVSKGSFLEYFDEIKKQAEEAKEAIKTVDGTVQGVTEAFNSANQDANWSTMADYLKQADDLFAKGKVGTDDFKTAAQFMSPTVINPDEKDNNGTDSYEMLVDGNVQMIGDVEFAKEQIKFYNASNPQLSFLDICLKAAGVTGWTVGYVDTVPKSYEYFDEGIRKEKQTLLADEIGVFDVDSQDLYSFLTQDVAKFFKCIFEFDFDKMQINAYHPENYGKDTNVNISFRNFQKSNNIKIDDTNIFTRWLLMVH